MNLINKKFKFISNYGLFFIILVFSLGINSKFNLIWASKEEETKKLNMTKSGKLKYQTSDIDFNLFKTEVLDKVVEKEIEDFKEQFLDCEQDTQVDFNHFKEYLECLTMNIINMYDQYRIKLIKKFFEIF
jgi:hypothetical protein